MAETALNKKELIVIGGSSGSLQVILHIVTYLPSGYPIPILLIIHRGSSGESLLVDLLRQRSKIPVVEVEEKQPIRPATIYLAPADFHVLIEKDHSFSLDYSEKQNFSRPSIDASFVAAAEVYHKTLTGILLSGANVDGAEGLKIIKESGGTTIIQDPQDAIVNYMPKQASMKSQIDQILTTEEITTYLLSLIHSAGA